MQELFDLLKTIEEEQHEKKPEPPKVIVPNVQISNYLTLKRIEEITKPTKRQKVIITVSSIHYREVIQRIQRIPTLKFYVATKDEKSNYWIFVTFKQSTELTRITDEKYWTPQNAYWDSIAYILLRGRLVETGNFGIWDDIRQMDSKKSAKYALELSDEEAKENLSLKEYNMYLKLKKNN